jgi:hypothetical protein
MPYRRRRQHGPAAIGRHGEEREQHEDGLIVLGLDAGGVVYKQYQEDYQRRDERRHEGRVELVDPRLAERMVVVTRQPVDSEDAHRHDNLLDNQLARAEEIEQVEDVAPREHKDIIAENIEREEAERRHDEVYRHILGALRRD